MDFWFDFYMVRKYNFTRYRKAKLLAKAIEKLNNPASYCYIPRDWLKIAEELSADKNVPTDYVPVRMMIASLQNGYINLVLNLYGRPKLIPSKGLQKRTKNLIQDLLLVYAGQTQVLELIETAQHLIDVIKAIYIIRFANFEDDSKKLAKKYLTFQSLNNMGLSDYNAEVICNMINKIVNANFGLPQVAQNELPNLMKLIPIQNIGAMYEIYNRPLISIREFLTKYPIDYTENRYGEIDVSKILGMPLRTQEEISASNQELVRSPILTEKPLKDQHIKLIYDKILKLKTKGLHPDLVALKLQINGIYIRSDDMLRIYDKISKINPNPMILHERSMEDLGFQTAPISLISKNGSGLRKFKDSPKRDSINSDSSKSDSSHSNSPKSNSPKIDSPTVGLNHNDQDGGMPERLNFKLQKLKHKHKTPPVKNKSVVQVHPVDECSEIEYCAYVSYGDELASLILGDNICDIND